MIWWIAAIRKCVCYYSTPNWLQLCRLKLAWPILPENPVNVTSAFVAFFEFTGQVHSAISHYFLERQALPLVNGASSSRGAKVRSRFEDIFQFFGQKRIGLTAFWCWNHHRESVDRWALSLWIWQGHRWLNLQNLSEQGFLHGQSECSGLSPHAKVGQVNTVNIALKSKMWQNIWC